MSSPRTRAGAAAAEDPTPRGAAPIRLATAEDIRKEMAKVYRQAKRGQIATAEATRLVYILGEIRKAIETETLEAQVAELERLYDQRTGIPHSAPGGRLAAPLRAVDAA